MVPAVAPVEFRRRLLHVTGGGQGRQRNRLLSGDLVCRSFGQKKHLLKFLRALPGKGYNQQLFLRNLYNGRYVIPVEIAVLPGQNRFNGAVRQTVTVQHAVTELEQQPGPVPFRNLIGPAVRNQGATRNKEDMPIWQPYQVIRCPAAFRHFFLQGKLSHQTSLRAVVQDGRREQDIHSSRPVHSQDRIRRNCRHFLLHRAAVHFLPLRCPFMQGGDHVPIGERNVVQVLIPVYCKIFNTLHCRFQEGTLLGNRFLPGKIQFLPQGDPVNPIRQIVQVVSIHREITLPHGRTRLRGNPLHPLRHIEIFALLV